MADQIKELYVIIGTNAEGEEGVASYSSPGTGLLTPLVGSLKRVPELLTVGQALANVTGKDFRLVKFSRRGNLDWIRNERNGTEAEDD